ncbi:MAG: RNA-binding transcriptional accessory protein [Kofleriaceae bacterium]|nr:RNA-binding transcriptional accessory protein [Kofleriaceae bacterium]
MTSSGAFDPVPALATELALPLAGVEAVVALLAEGNTVPFIARYRKERTGGLDEVQIRAIEERRAYLLELDERRRTVIASIRDQGKLTPELETRLLAATTKAALEDLYLPFKPRRRTRATAARERGLEPLAARIVAQPADGDPLAEAEAFVRPAGPEVEADKVVATAADAHAGARDIVAEQLAETAEIRAFVRGIFTDHGELVSEGVPGKTAEPTRFEQYYQFREPVRTVPSHRFLAIRRGEAEGVLRAHVAVDEARVVAGVERLARVDDASPWASALREAAVDAYRRLLAPSVENDLRVELKLRSDAAAVDVFADNLRNLMLAAPLGGRAVIGIDPGLRTGCKCVAVDATGKFLGTVTLFLAQGEAQLAKARDEALAFIQQHTPAAIAVGNGTGGREAEGFVRRLLADAKIADLFVVSVNEAGASVYSASDVAREEFPDLDLTIRGAISIARRLQDPLAELVKIEPKAIGVGQYQHDVHQPLLAKKLGDVVESCVNHVGVELNTASSLLLAHVAGIGKALAKKIVVHREQHGAFRSRRQLLEVSGLGPKAFEQAAGFLRIRGGEHPLDASAVHPERYGLVERMAGDLGVEVGALIGNQELVDKIDLSRYVTVDAGEPTLRDIVDELKKPGRDPRAEFEPPKFRDDVTALTDLKPGMALEGVVTNVTAFGAFVDIGVHQDGLIHVSQLADRFVKDPAEVVKVGDKIKVRVISVDLERRRIALTARREDAPARGRQERGRGGRGQGRGPQGQQGQGQGQAQGQGAQAQGQGDGPGAAQARRPGPRSWSRRRRAGQPGRRSRRPPGRAARPRPRAAAAARAAVAAPVAAAVVAGRALTPAVAAAAAAVAARALIAAVAGRWRRRRR